MSRLITTFPGKIPELLSAARAIKIALTESMNFQHKGAEFEAEVGKLSEDIDRLQLADEAAITRDKNKVAYRDEMKEELIAQLKRVAKHVELACDGDVAKLKSSAYVVYEAKNNRNGNHLALGIPVLKVKHGKATGTLVVSAKAVPGTAVYELQITDKDPTLADNFWQHGLHPSCSHIDVANLIAGTNYWLRMRCIGTGGTGPWSPPSPLMSL